jgi:peptidoglycan/LPS O-acetylase OafA/YrhL
MVLYSHVMISRHRFEALDAWRGLCAILVAIEHLNTTSFLRENELTHHAYRFVDFFFVLSGFVIAHAYRDKLVSDRSAVLPFLGRRFGRLWPLHIAVLGVLVAVELATLLAGRLGISMGREVFTGRTSPAALPTNFLLAHGWGMHDGTTWNGPSWSISTEWLAYAVFAGCCAVVGRRWLSATSAVILVASASVILWIAPFGMKSNYDYAVFRCFYGFMTGVLVRDLWSRFAPRWGTWAELGSVVAVVVAVTWLPLDGTALIVTPLFGFTVWVFASEDGALSRVLRGRAAQALGAWSYSIYMVHFLVVFGIVMVAAVATKLGLPLMARIDGVTTIVGPGWVTALITVAYVATVIALSRITYLRIELPGQRWAARRFAQSTGSVPAGAIEAPSNS